MAIPMPETPPAKDVIRELDSLRRRMAELRALLRFVQSREHGSAAKSKQSGSAKEGLCPGDSTVLGHLRRRGTGPSTTTNVKTFRKEN